MAEVEGFLRDGAPAGLYQQGHNVMLYWDDVPTSKPAFPDPVSGHFDVRVLRSLVTL